MTGPVDVVPTFKGYAPVLPVKVDLTGLEYVLYISSKSLTDALEPLRAANKGSFAGLKFSVRKSSDDQFAGYEVRAQ